MINSSSRLRHVRNRASLLVVFAALSCVAGLVPVSAQPSGGPYGPIQQRYELPQAKKLFYVAPDAQGSDNGTSLEQPTSFASAIERVWLTSRLIRRSVPSREITLITA